MAERLSGRHLPPEAIATRAELAEALVRVFPGDGGSPSFDQMVVSDVPLNAWYARTAAIPQARGRIMGVSYLNGLHFESDRPFNRDELALILRRATGWAELEEPGGETKFGLAPPWTYACVVTSTKAGLFHPQEYWSSALVVARAGLRLLLSRLLLRP